MDGRRIAIVEELAIQREEHVMELYLVQHGECRSEAEDPERSLTEQGAQQVRRMAAWAREVGVSVQQIRQDGKWSISWLMVPQLLTPAVSRR